MNSQEKANKDNFSGYLSKRSLNNPNRSKERYFTILEGQFLAYFRNKEQRLLKGIFDLDLIKNITSVGVNNIQFEYGKITLVFICSRKVERDNWCNFLTSLIKELKENKQENLSLYDIKSNTIEIDNQGNEMLKENLKPELQIKPWKNFNFSKDALKLFEKHKIILETDREKEIRKLSKKTLQLKGIDKIIDLEDPSIRSRICYGFLEKKQPNDYIDIYQNRWLFIISSRPLTDIALANDDVTLNPLILKNKLKFDTLYYFQVENSNDYSEAKGFIDLKVSNGISISEKNSRYTIQIDMGVRIYEFFTVYQYERDKWRECLTNSLKACTDLKNSITKTPRNIIKLLNIFENEGIGSLKIIIEEEIQEILMKTLINDFKTLKNVIDELKKCLYSTMDGCLLSEQFPEEIFKNYVQLFNIKILLLIQDFWSKNCSKLYDSDILQLSIISIEHDKKLDEFGVSDPNFRKNADEMLKILCKKNYWDFMKTIEDILHVEREKKVEKLANKQFSTLGPQMFFKSIFSLFELIKNDNHQIILEFFLDNIKQIIVQYLVGLDTIIRQRELDIDKEFLIAIANNTFTITALLEDLIDSIETYNIYSREEILIKIQREEIVTSLNIICNFCIFRFVVDLYDAILEKFENHFLNLETHSIIELCDEIYSEFEVHINPKIKQKAWKEVLRNSISNYILSLFLIDNKKIKKIEELRSKLREDNKKFANFYINRIGEEATQDILKNIDYFLEFLESSSDMISLPCQSLREFNGDSFTIENVRDLIDLRCDFDLKEKQEALETCIQVLKNYKEENKDKPTNPLFDFVKQKINSKLKRASYSLSEKNLESIDDDLNSVNKGKRLSKKHMIDFGIEVSDSEDDEPHIIDNENKNKIENFFVPKQNKAIKNSEIEIIFSGEMKKKSHNIWQNRFFQIKNGQLYWFKKNTNSTANNFLNLKEIKKVLSVDQNKFNLICNKKDYEFLVENKEIKERWIEVINKEIKKINRIEKKKYNDILHLDLKKKIIEDFFGFPDIEENKEYIKNIVNESMKKENFFKSKNDMLLNLNVKKEFLKKKTLNPEILNKPIRTEDQYKSDNNFLEVENSYKDRKGGIFNCFKKITKICQKKKNSKALLDSGYN